MPTPARSHETQVPISHLADFSIGLVRALGRSGLDLERIRHLLTESVHVECPTCGIRLTGQELADLSAPPTGTGGEPPKQRRVRLGYCPREGCKGRFLTWKMTGVEGLDWPALVKESAVITSHEDAEQRAAQEAEARIARRKTRGLVLKVAAAIVAVVLVWHWYRSGAYIPGLSKRPRVFIVESNGEETNPPTSSPRVFQTR